MSLPTQIGAGHIYGLTGGTIVLKGPDGTTISGYVSPNLKTLRSTHVGEKDRIKGQNGEYNSIILKGEMFECEFNFIPEGATIANSKSSATLPPLGSSATLSGLPVIAQGSASDVFNSATWIYEGGGTLNGDSENHWTATLPLCRYPGITTVTAITA